MLTYVSSRINIRVPQTIEMSEEELRVPVLVRYISSS
jgi:hypothetical protein